MSALAQILRAKLCEAADPARAPGMQAYMKSAMPYLGVSTVPLRAAFQSVFAGLAWTDAAEVRRYVAANEARLSGLSKREALKNIGAAAA